MKRIQFIHILISLILCSCTGNSFSKNTHIDVEEIFHITDNCYYVYFYSKYCAECNNISISYQKDYSKSMYYVNLDQISSESFNKMKIVYSPIENNISEYINITTLTDLVFYSAPCIYYFERIENVSTLKYIYSNKNSINQLISSWG